MLKIWKIHILYYVNYLFISSYCWITELEISGLQRVHNNVNLNSRKMHCLESCSLL